MSGKAAELEKVEEILADPSGQTSQYFYYCYHLKVIWAFNFVSGSALEIHVSKLPNLNC